MFRRQHLFTIVDNVLYLCLMFLGFYFIYEGYVVPRFVSKRTNFAQYEETVKEFPTILTFIDIPQKDKFQLGNDFNISIWPETPDWSFWKPKNLTYGENFLDGSPLRVDFERWHIEGRFKITALNFSPDMPMTYNIRYTFENSTGVSKVSLQLSSEDGYAIDNRMYDTGTATPFHFSFALVLLIFCRCSIRLFAL